MNWWPGPCLHWMVGGAATWCIISACSGNCSRRLLLGQTRHRPHAKVPVALGTGQELLCLAPMLSPVTAAQGQANPSFRFIPSCVQCRLISSKEPMYEQQLHIFKFPFCTIENKICIHFSAFYCTLAPQDINFQAYIT